MVHCVHAMKCGPGLGAVRLCRSARSRRSKVRRRIYERVTYFRLKCGQRTLDKIYVAPMNDTISSVKIKIDLDV